MREQPEAPNRGTPEPRNARNSRLPNSGSSNAQNCGRTELQHNQIRTYRDLRLYQAAFELQQQVFAISKNLPKSEHYALTDQVRRSSRSIGANLAEAWAKRKYAAHFASTRTDIDGEIEETYHWLDTALARGYLRQDEHAKLAQQVETIGRMLGSMMIKADTFVL